jgi:type II secretory ATPase GspE/PulE/Tfp pilus assembly ATPase PilB-like protein
MLRLLVVLAGAVVIGAIDAQVLLAADDSSWPSMGVRFYRGNGAYLSPWKIFCTWLIFLSWVGTTDWISQDAQALKLRYTLWNPIVFFTFLVSLLLLWILPWFAVGIVLLVIAYAAPLGTYIVYRNRQVTSRYDKVLTTKHSRRWLARKMNAIGINMAGADVDPRELGPDVKLTSRGGGSERDDNVNLLTARNSPGFMPAKLLIDDALQQRATHIMLDYKPDSVAVRYQVDGVWHDRSAVERAEGDPVLEVFKGLAGMKIEDRRSRQTGDFGIEAAKQKINCLITSQGTSTGERVLLQFALIKQAFRSLDELGMRAKTQEQLQEVLAASEGLLIFSSMPAGGLTTAIDLSLLSTDRFIRNFVAVVDQDKPDHELENVHVTNYSAAEGESALSVLPKLIRTYPDVIVVRDVADLETLTVLCEQAADRKLVITSTRAKEAVEALLRLMILKIPPADFAMVIKAVLNVRLVRKLCETCREAYPPPAEVLKQLGLPAGRIESLYRPPTQPIDPKHPDVVCETCQGIGYFGRTGIFELLLVDDTIRQVLTTAPKLENLRAAARKNKHRTLQEEGVLLVARGVTSLQELLRVLKQ